VSAARGATSGGLGSARIVLAGLLPLVLIGAMTAWFLGGGAVRLGLVQAPIEKLAIERIVFKPQEIVLHVRNEGPGPMTVGQVFVNDAIWDFSITPGRLLERLRGATISIPFDWLEGEPYVLTVVSGTGIRHTREVEIATMTPAVSLGTLGVFGLLGVYVGVVPVLLGLLWLPFLRSIPRAWLDFWLSFTMGLLVFLGIDTIHESFEILDRVPEFLNGLMLIAIGSLGAFFGLVALGRVLQPGTGARGAGAGAPAGGMGLALMIAIGIGLHNLGEGLAIGAAYTLGEVALGSFLIVGFTLHNTTEGLAILSPLIEAKTRVRDLVLLGVVGGAPTILGTWTGAFTYSDPLSLLFLGLGAGAIFQVVWVLARGRAAKGETIVDALARPLNVAGLFAGFLVMYATSLLVAG
jgi:zinc transporter ZupT